MTQEDGHEVPLARRIEKAKLNTTPSDVEKANEKVVEEEEKVVFTPLDSRR